MRYVPRLSTRTTLLKLTSRPPCVWNAAAIASATRCPDACSDEDLAQSCRVKDVAMDRGVSSMHSSIAASTQALAWSATTATQVGPAPLMVHPYAPAALAAAFTSLCTQSKHSEMLTGTSVTVSCCHSLLASHAKHATGGCCDLLRLQLGRRSHGQHPASCNCTDS